MSREHLLSLFLFFSLLGIFLYFTGCATLSPLEEKDPSFIGYEYVNPGDMLWLDAYSE